MAIAVKDQGKEFVPAQSPVTLFRTEDPAAIGTAVAGTAKVLSDFVKQRRQQEMWERQLEDERMAEIVAEWERRYRVERWS